MPDPKLGKKFTCYKCQGKFYDLNKLEAICPRCGVNQKDAPPASKSSPSLPSPAKAKLRPLPAAASEEGEDEELMRELDDIAIEEDLGDEEFPEEVEEEGGGLNE